MVSEPLPDCKLGGVPTNQADSLCSGASRMQGLSVTFLVREPPCPPWPPRDSGGLGESVKCSACSGTDLWDRPTSSGEDARWSEPRG